MNLQAFLEQMEQIAPRELALGFDNPGLLIGPEKQEIRKVLIALDCSPATVKEAISWGADLLLTHHPVFFGGTKHILPDDPATAAPWLLLRHGIGLFAAHTNLDAAPGGVNDCLAEALGMQNVAPLPPDGLGRMGRVPATSLAAFGRQVQQALRATVRIAGAPDAPIATVAVVGGSGGDAIYAAKAAGADVLVTGEIKHHQALEAGILGLCIIEAGHYETEHVVLCRLLERLQSFKNDVQYKVTCSEVPCLQGL